MDGTTAQIAALAIAGNHYLKGGDLGGFWPGSAVFTSCASVDFVTLSGASPKIQEHPYADDPLRWFERQRSEGVQAFHLVHLARDAPGMTDRESAGFVGGGSRKILEAATLTEMSGWEAGWRLGPSQDPNTNVWQVRYGRFTTMPRRDLAPSDLTRVAHALGSALADIAMFARKTGNASAWAVTFEEAEQLLRRKLPLANSACFRGFEPFVADLRARQLLAAVEKAWVFGGEGSWNAVSVTPEAQTDHARLSDALFYAARNALSAAVNATADSILRMPAGDIVDKPPFSAS